MKQMENLAEGEISNEKFKGKQVNKVRAKILCTPICKCQLKSLDSLDFKDFVQGFSTCTGRKLGFAVLPSVTTPSCCITFPSALQNSLTRTFGVAAAQGKEESNILQAEPYPFSLGSKSLGVTWSYQAWRLSASTDPT